MSSGPPPVPGGRSPDEREAARRERAARRAGVTPPQQQHSDDWLAEAERLTGSRSATTVGELEATLGHGDNGPRRRAGTGGLRWGRIMAIAALALVLGGVAWFCVSLFQPFAGEGKGQLRVTIPAGSSLGQIAERLEQEGVIANASFFELRARLAGRSDQLKPGSYVLRRDMSFVAALDALERGVPPDVVRVTIPEGRSRSEVAALLKDSVRGDYMRATRHSPLLRPRDYGAKRARNLEGFLFPATYELKRGESVRALVDQQLRTFRRQLDGVDLRYARSKNLTPYDVLIIASMVEREVQVARERPLVAAVIYNRLKQGMQLGIDATTRFAVNQWSEPLRQSELANPSPYNTRVHSGLPPGPIGSPGLASIEAAARPARTDYLFYVAEPCGNGSHAFSATDAEFQRDVERYRAERERRGGNSPTDCG